MNIFKKLFKSFKGCFGCFKQNANMGGDDVKELEQLVREETTEEGNRQAETHMVDGMEKEEEELRTGMKKEEEEDGCGGGGDDSDDDFVTANESDEDDDGEDEEAREDGGSAEDDDDFVTAHGSDEDDKDGDIDLSAPVPATGIHIPGTEVGGAQQEVNSDRVSRDGDEITQLNKLEEMIEFDQRYPHNNTIRHNCTSGAPRRRGLFDYYSRPDSLFGERVVFSGPS